MIDLGKDIFIWTIEASLGGNVQAIAAAVKEAGFQSAILHHVNTANWRTSLRVALVPALQAAGIKVVAGAAVYGENPALEGAQAAAICNDLGIDTFVFDAESAFDAVPHSDSAAVHLLQSFKQKAKTGTKAGFCWWPFHHRPGAPNTLYHPKAVLWAAMTPNYGGADFGMPMAYWSWGDDPGKVILYVNEAIAQWREITDKPLIPAGRAYIGDGGTPTPGGIAVFEKRARELGCVGVSWWALQFALDQVHLPAVWPALAALPKFEQLNPPPQPPAPPPPETLDVDDFVIRQVYPWMVKQGYQGPAPKA